MPFTQKSEAGFSLVEMMIAVMVLGIGLVSAAAMQTRALEEANEAARQSQRVQGAEYWMEDVISRPLVADGILEPEDLFLDNCTGLPECGDGQWYEASGAGNLGASHTSQYKVTLQEPMEFLVKIEVRTVPTYGKGGAERQAYLDQKAINFSYVRSARYN